MTETEHAACWTHGNRQVVLHGPRPHLQIIYIYIYIYTIKITRQFRRLVIPLIVLYARAARKLTYKNSCGRCQKRLDISALRYKTKNHINSD